MAERHHTETATYWKYAGSNGYGGYLFDTPRTLMVRWEERDELFHLKDGEEVTSNAIVFLPEDVEVGDYLALGDRTVTSDPTSLEDAYQVRRFRKISDLRGIKMLRKAYL